MTGPDSIIPMVLKSKTGCFEVSYIPTVAGDYQISLHILNSTSPPISVTCYNTGRDAIHKRRLAETPLDSFVAEQPVRKRQRTEHHPQPTYGGMHAGMGTLGGIPHMPGMGGHPNYYNPAANVPQVQHQPHAVPQAPVGAPQPPAQDYSKSVEVYRQAAADGSAEAQYNLGVMYSHGQGSHGGPAGRVAVNKAEAVKWYKMSSEKGFSRAQYNLGVMYRDGDGVPRDFQEAHKWFLKAAEQDDWRAQVNLGAMYQEGQGVLQSYPQAMFWYKKAADLGFSEGFYNVAVLYDKGLGVNQNRQEAIRWYTTAANKGNQNAQFNLGIIYGQGKGVDQDFHQALKWFKLAAEQGDNEAHAYVQNIENITKNNNMAGSAGIHGS